MKISVFNYHITGNCNYDCLYCFGGFHGEDAPSLAEAKRKIDGIRTYFVENGVENGRINLSGGEPLLYSHLDELIDFIHASGMRVSLITNGSKLTAERIRRWRGKVDMVGISIDSLLPETLQKIGRCSNERMFSCLDAKPIFDALEKCGIALKVNITVSKLNCNEDFSSLFAVCRPYKVKLLQMHILNGVNEGAAHLAIGREEYETFVSRIKEVLPAGCILVPEGERDMENSYPMITPSGKVKINDGGEYKDWEWSDCLPLAKVLAELPVDEKKYRKRYLEGEE